MTTRAATSARKYIEPRAGFFRKRAFVPSSIAVDRSIRRDELVRLIRRQRASYDLRRDFRDLEHRNERTQILGTLQRFYDALIGQTHLRLGVNHAERLTFGRENSTIPQIRSLERSVQKRRGMS